MDYREEVGAADRLKQEYVAGIEHIIRAQEKKASAKRKTYAKRIFSSPERARADLRAQLGFPLVKHTPKGLPAVVSTPLFETPEFTAERMQIEILDGVQMAGLFFRVKGEGARPLVLVQHGGIGTPELIADFYGGTANYNDMLARVRAQGVHVFAPLLLLWNKETHPVPYDRDTIDARLKRVGSSLAAIELFGITRILDHFSAQPYVSTLGMLGLSYGGFYTLYAAALDTRIRAAVCSSHFFTRDDLPNTDRTWQGSAHRIEDAEAAALVYPRALFIALGDSDPLFPLQTSMPVLDRLSALCEDTGVGTDWLNITVFEGKHEFPKEDDVILHFANALKA